MKHQAVRKRLLLETLVVMAGLGFGGGGAYYLSVLHDEYEQENLSLQTQVATLNNEMTSLNDKYLKIRENHELYEEAKKKSSTDRLSVNRDLIRRLFAGYNDKYFLKNLSLQMAPVQQVEDAPYKRPTTQLVYSEVNVTVDALTDEDVFRLIQSIQQDFPGAVKFMRLAITRQNRLTPDNVKEIVEKGEIKMVTASLKFLWMGIETTDNNQQASVETHHVATP